MKTVAEFLPGRYSLQKLDYVLILALFGLTLALRLPAIQPILPTSDAAAYAIGVDFFDPAQDHPQPPGYHSYLLLVKATRVLLGGNTDLALFILSIFFSALAVVGLYLVGLELFGRKVGFATAALWCINPAFWQMGMMAQSHAAENALAVLAVWCVLRRNRLGGRWHLWAALMVGLSLVIRPQAGIVTLPVWLFGCRNFGWKAFGTGGVLIVLLAGLSELGGMIAAGAEAYRQAGQMQWEQAVWPYSLLAAAQQGPRALFEAIQTSMGKINGFVFGAGSHVSILSWFLAWVYGLGHVFRPKRLVNDWRSQFLLVWALPILLFHFFIHVGVARHVQVYFPVILLVAAVGIVHFSDELGNFCCCNCRCDRWVYAGILGLAMLLGAGVIATGSWPGLKADCNKLQATIRYIVDSGKPEETVVVQSDVRGEFNVYEYYLMRNHIVLLAEETLANSEAVIKQDKNSRTVEIGKARRVVFINPEARVMPEGKIITLKHGAKVCLVELAEPGMRLQFNAQGVSILK